MFLLTKLLIELNIQVVNIESKSILKKINPNENNTPNYIEEHINIKSYITTIFPI